MKKALLSEAIEKSSILILVGRELNVDLINAFFSKRTFVNIISDYNNRVCERLYKDWEVLSGLQIYSTLISSS